MDNAAFIIGVVILLGKLIGTLWVIDTATTKGRSEFFWAVVSVASTILAIVAISLASNLNEARTEDSSRVSDQKMNDQSVSVNRHPTQNSIPFAVWRSLSVSSRKIASGQTIWLTMLGALIGLAMGLVMAAVSSEVGLEKLFAWSSYDGEVYAEGKALIILVLLGSCVGFISATLRRVRR